MSNEDLMMNGVSWSRFAKIDIHLAILPIWTEEEIEASQNSECGGTQSQYRVSQREQINKIQFEETSIVCNGCCRQ